MTDELTQSNATTETTPVATPESTSAATPNRGGARRGGPRGTGRGRGARGRRDEPEEKEEFEQKMIDLARVTRVMAGGKRMRFRACIAIGDRQGRVGIGVAKGQDVTVAIAKAVNQAKKDIVTVPFIKETLPFAIEEKFKAARILLKPATVGKGIVAGGAMRIVLELAGVPNVVAKMRGANNKISNVKAVMNALKRYAAWAEARGLKTTMVAGDEAGKSPRAKGSRSHVSA